MFKPNWGLLILLTPLNSQLGEIAPFIKKNTVVINQI